MAKVTKIKAKDPSKPQEKPAKTPEKKAEKKPEKSAPKKVEQKPEKKEKAGKTKKEAKKVFILFRPFCALGRYVRDSWNELRQVRWPNRKATWKLVLAVIIYSAIFLVIIMLLDTLFSYLFNLIIT